MSLQSGFTIPSPNMEEAITPKNLGSKEIFVTCEDQCFKVPEEQQCRIRIDPNLVEKFKRLPGGINEVGTKIIRDIGLRYEYDTGVFDILGPDPEILSLAIETLRFWVDEDHYPKTGITCQVGYPNKGIVFWRFHGDYARKFDHLFENEIESLKRIPSLNIKAVPTKKNLEFVEIYCNFGTYHLVKDELMRIASELAKIFQNDFFVPISDFHKARKFARSKGNDKSVLFALKEYADNDKFRVWIFARDYSDIIRARKEWINHVGRIARDTVFEERRGKYDRRQAMIYDENSIASAQFFGHESSKESDLTGHKQNLEQKKLHTNEFLSQKIKLKPKVTQVKTSPRDKLQRKASGTTYDNMNFPRPTHMFFPVQKEFIDEDTYDSQQPEEPNTNPWLDPMLLQITDDGNTKHSNPVAESKWTTEPAFQLYQAKKPNRPNELNRIYMHHQVHRNNQEDSNDTKTELTLVNHPNTNLIDENIITLCKSQIITAVTDPRFGPRREQVQNGGLTVKVNVNKNQTGQQLGSVRQPPSLHSLKQMKHREAQSNLRYHINVNGLDIFMYRYDVVKLNNMDALVNVVDKNLQEGGHIAKDMAAAAGRQVADEIKVYLFNNGPLKVAETCVTSAGKIPCLGIINVAGPKWKDYHSVEEKCAIDLHTAIYNVLKTAEKHKYRKIGLPTICSESFFGIPKEIVAEVHVKALVDYSLAMGPLYPILEIHLVDTNVDTLFAIKQAYEDWASSPAFFDMAEKYKTATGSIPNHMKELSQRAESAVQLKSVPSHRSKNVVTFTEQSYTKEGHQKWSFNVLNKVSVHVYIGSVVKLTNVEAIVCGVDRKLKGNLAKLIRANGGTKYELALSQARGQRSLVEGEVVVCTAGDLPVKWVFHSIISQPMRKVSLKNLARLDSVFTQILHAANKLDIKSLAMPLIGAGRLREKFEIEQCSLQLVDNIIELCLSTGQELKLKEIHLVNVSELNTQYICQALRTRAHTKLRVENEGQPPSRQDMFTGQDQLHTSTTRHHQKRSRSKSQNHPESPKRVSPLQKRNGRILYDKNALLEEQYKRRIRDMEEEQKAATKRNQEEFSTNKGGQFNPRMVNTWLQNTDNDGYQEGIYPTQNYKNGLVRATIPNGLLRQRHQAMQQKTQDALPNPVKVKSRAESYHHSYNRDDLLASHRENWDLVRQRSHSTDALPRKDENLSSEDKQTYRSAKDLRNPHDRMQVYPDASQMYPDVRAGNKQYGETYEVKENYTDFERSSQRSFGISRVKEHIQSGRRQYSEYKRSSHRNSDTYDTNESNQKDNYLYTDYERSPRRNFDTYESVVTEREAIESDHKLYRNRDEPRFRDHRHYLANKPAYDKTIEIENKSKSERPRRSLTNDINKEVERILKERNKDQWQDSRQQHLQNDEEKNYKEKEQVEMRQVQKLWAINDVFQENLESHRTNYDTESIKNNIQKENLIKETNEIQLKDKNVENDEQNQKRVEDRTFDIKTKSTKEAKETKKSRIKYDNRIIIDPSKHKSKRKDSKKARRHPSKTSTATRVSHETVDSFRDTEIPIQDGRTDITTTSTGLYSPVKRYDSQIDKRYSQFDNYTNSDVYPRTPEPSSIRGNSNQDIIDNKRKQEINRQIQVRHENSTEQKEYSRNNLSSLDKKSADKDDEMFDTGMAKSVKSISSRPTVDSRTVKLNKKKGNTNSTFSVLAGDVSMMEQFQNLSGRVENYRTAVEVG